MKWFEGIDTAVDDLHIKVRSPVLRDGQNVRELMLESDRAEEILEYFSKRVRVTLSRRAHADVAHNDADRRGPLA
jgi:hypothetical protein